MSKVTGAQISEIASGLAGIAAIFNPALGPVIVGVVGAATKLNELVAAMRAETERLPGESDEAYNTRVDAEVQAAWNKVSDDYLLSSAALKESFKAHPGK